MIGKSRRSKRRTNNPDKPLVTAANANVVPISTRRKRRPKPPQNKVVPSTQPVRPTTTTKVKVPAPAGTDPRRTPRQRPLPRKNERANRRFRLKLPKPILYPLRFIIVGVGIGAFIGTILAISNSRPYITSTQKMSTQESPAASDAPPTPAVTELPLKTPLVALADSVKTAIAAEKDIYAALLFVDLDNGEYLDVGGSRPVSAASTIKIPILVAFFEAVDQGKIKLDDTLTLSEASKGTGSGELQYKPVGSSFSALYVATEMSVHSDNTATNMIIEKLGGAGVLNSKFRQWGMNQTQINNVLPDLEGTNLTTARDLAYILARISQGDLLSTRSRDRLFRIMGETENDRLLPQSLGEDAAIVHKTGDIGTIIGDAGIIDMPNGKRYVASIFVERPYDAPQGKELLHTISRQFYEYLETGVQPPKLSTPPPSAQPTPETGGISPETEQAPVDEIPETGEISPETEQAPVEPIPETDVASPSEV